MSCFSAFVSPYFWLMTILLFFFYTESIHTNIHICTHKCRCMHGIIHIYRGISSTGFSIPIYLLWYVLITCIIPFDYDFYYFFFCCFVSLLFNEKLKILQLARKKNVYMFMYIILFYTLHIQHGKCQEHSEH